MGSGDDGGESAGISGVGREDEGSAGENRTYGGCCDW